MQLKKVKKNTYTLKRHKILKSHKTQKRHMRIQPLGEFLGQLGKPWDIIFGVQYQLSTI